MATLGNLPVELFSRVADYASAKVALSLHLASGRAAPLGEAFRAANELRRMSGEDAGDDDALFRRWEALVVPLRCVVAEMSRKLFGRVFSGAARRGIAALSMLDASRLDLDLARQGRFQISRDEALDRAWEQIQHMDGLPDGFSRADMLEAVKDSFGGRIHSLDAQFDSAITSLLREVEDDSMLSTWILRHSICHSSQMPGLDGASNLGFGQPLVDAAVMMHLMIHEIVDRPLRLGDKDVAFLYATSLPPMYPLRIHEIATSIDQMNQFHGIVGAFALCPVIATDERLRANLALQRHVVAQREWFAGIHADRKVARAKMAEGDRAHEAWLAATYATNPLRPMEAADATSDAVGDGGGAAIQLAAIYSGLDGGGAAQD